MNTWKKGQTTVSIFGSNAEKVASDVANTYQMAGRIVRKYLRGAPETIPGDADIVIIVEQEVKNA